LLRRDLPGLFYISAFESLKPVCAYGTFMASGDKYMDIMEVA
jgi:hypothetical protein